MTVFSDGVASAALSYDDLGRMTRFTDTQGSQVDYEYDAMSRITKVTPPQGTNYRTEYSYKEQQPQ
jgi:YD repeat-containing protein